MDNGQVLRVENEDTLRRLESFLFFRRQSPSWSRESKLIESIFPIGIWWICLASFRAEFLWRHRLFGLFSITSSFSITVQTNASLKGDLFSPWNQNQTNQSWWSKSLLRERDTHCCQCPFCFIWPSDDFTCSKAGI